MIVEEQYFTHSKTPDSLTLESGQTLSDVTIAYETYGQLNKDKSNAILVCHALSGDAHAAFKSKKDPKYIGWWDWFIGPGKTLDTKKYYVISTHVIGGCKGSTGPSSINPKTEKPYGLSFPVITVGDMVHAQKPLMDHLGIEQLNMVIGGSMGGMHALEWAIQYPQMVKSCVPIAATPFLSPQALAFDIVGRHAIMSDPHWKSGNYKNQDNQKGLEIARMIGHITYLSNDSLDKRFGRKLQKRSDYGYDFDTEFQVESYLKYQGDKFISQFDANSYLYLTKALSYFDLAKKYHSLEKAFKKTLSKFLIIAITSDWLYTCDQSKLMAKT